jgi:peptidoglycan/LPS O-acetylase OafA/YrhL
MNKKKNERIAIIDGFRALAIISVILYHYLYKWNDSINPYLGSDLFHQGFKGVSFFFIISGFVICYTLENTTSFVFFWKKRFIRLFPSMLIASLLTFIFLILFDNIPVFPKSHYFRNLAISITFLPPNLFDWVFGTKNNFSYLNYSYWSLWPEIQFYFLSSCIYFLNPGKFRKNFIFVCLLILLFYNLIVLFEINYFSKAINLFSIVKFLPFFLSGSLFYMIYDISIPSKWYILLLIFSFIVLNIPFSKVNLISYSLMFGLFFCFIYCPQILGLLENKFIVYIGTSSYFLYLIHEYIGVVLIKKIVNLFYSYSIVAPLIMLIFMIVFSVFYTKYVESKFSTYLKNKIFKNV